MTISGARRSCGAQFHRRNRPGRGARRKRFGPLVRRGVACVETPNSLCSQSMQSGGCPLPNMYVSKCLRTRSVGTHAIAEEKDAAHHVVEVVPAVTTACVLVVQRERADHVEAAVVRAGLAAVVTPHALELAAAHGVAGWGSARPRRGRVPRRDGPLRVGVEPLGRAVGRCAPVRGEARLRHRAGLLRRQRGGIDGSRAVIPVERLHAGQFSCPRKPPVSPPAQHPARHDGITSAHCLENGDVGTEMSARSCPVGRQTRPS